MRNRGKRYSNLNTPFYIQCATDSGRTYFRTMNNDDMKAAMGCDPKRHWPLEGVPERLVLGVRVKVHPKATKGQGRRCVAFCDHCGRWVCAGHLGQHVGAHIAHSLDGKHVE